MQSAPSAGGRRRSSALYVASLALIISSTIPLADSQLAFIQQNSAVNPILGQGTAPELGDDTPVQTYIVLNRLLEVNDNSYSFKVNFWWGMIWEDARALPIIESNTLSDPTYVCQAWCSTEQGLDALLSQQGFFQNVSSGIQGLCCDNVYVPSAAAQNVIGYDVQTLPIQYQLTTLPNNMVSYRVQVQGDFYANFNFDSYPFDRHELVVSIQTDFMPSAFQDLTGSGADFLVLYAQNFGNGVPDEGNQKPISVDVYNAAQLSQGQAWQIDKLDLTIMNNTQYFTSTNVNPSLETAQLNGENVAGVRFVIHISRTSKGFYALMIIVPISLIILFSFVIFILPITQIKGRMNIMATLFLTLIVLQFVLEGIMPSSYTLMPPYFLLLVSYIYVFTMVGLAIFTNSLATQWQRRSARIGRDEARQKFRKWIDELPPPPSDSHLKFGHLPVLASEANHHHLRLKRILTRRHPAAKTDIEKRDPGTPDSTRSSNGRVYESPSHVRPITTDGDYAFHLEKPMNDSAESKELGGHVNFEVDHNGEDSQGKPVSRSKSRPWTMKERSSIMTFLLRNDRIRWWSMWWYFIGRPESKEYCEFCAMKVEKYALPFMFFTYVMCVTVIFVVAQTSSSSNLDATVA